MDLSPSQSSAAPLRRGGTADVPAGSGALRRPPEQVATQRSGENFPVALRVLPRPIRGHLEAVYGYARFVDDLGDEAPGDRLRLLDAVEADLDLLYSGAEPTLPVIAVLAPTVRECALPAQPLRDLLAANRLDQTVTRYPSHADLVGYCTLSANPVGRLVLQIAGQATPDRLAWSDDVCTALQIVEHLQDIGEDYLVGRVYLPQRDLVRFGVPESDLGAPTASRALRRLVAAEARRAAEMLDSGRPLVASLRGWGRLRGRRAGRHSGAGRGRLRPAEQDPATGDAADRGRDAAAGPGGQPPAPAGAGPSYRRAGLRPVRADHLDRGEELRLRHPAAAQGQAAGAVRGVRVRPEDRRHRGRLAAGGGQAGRAGGRPGRRAGTAATPGRSGAGRARRRGPPAAGASRARSDGCRWACSPRTPARTRPGWPTGSGSPCS